MNTIPNTIAPRSPLTLAELETLAVMIDSATKHMSDARQPNGEYVWGTGFGLTEAYGDIFGAFYDIRNNTAALAAGAGSPFARPENSVRITAG